jgi:DNA phosphorothioation-associated DGQHR protein 1
MDSAKNFLEIPALKVKQPLGDFYVISISARELLDVTFSEPMKYIDNSGKVQGSQRPKDVKRLKEIAQYIQTVEMAFPNSIILAANYTQNGEITKDVHQRWKIIEDKDSYKLIIPQKIKLAAVIDGQHRLNAFEYVTAPDRFTDLQLLCSVYFDLPNSYQAFLFATINSNQKKVDRSLALDQFGYNVDDEPEKSWTPEKFAVFFSRKFNVDKEFSPFYKHIKVAPLGADKLFGKNIEQSWVVSTATIVDGIGALISSNVKRDRILMQQKSFLSGRSRDMIKDIKDFSPLRNLFILNKDKTIYDTIINFFTIAEELFWNKASAKSYINKTVGVQALFDILKNILIKEKSDVPDKINFRNYLINSSSIDFSDKFFQASGIGRSRIKNSILLSAGLISIDKIKKNDVNAYNQIISGLLTDTQKEKWIWEEEAENTIINTLENISWNYDDKTVSILEDYDYDKILKFNNFRSFFDKLIELAEISYSSHLPDDSEFRDEQREKFDVEDLVNSHLVDYDENLRLLGWKL